VIAVLCAVAACVSLFTAVSHLWRGQVVDRGTFLEVRGRRRRAEE
jgi:hypothetical protein